MTDSTPVRHPMSRRPSACSSRKSPIWSPLTSKCLTNGVRVSIARWFRIPNTRTSLSSLSVVCQAYTWPSKMRWPLSKSPSILRNSSKQFETPWIPRKLNLDPGDVPPSPGTPGWTGTSSLSCSARSRNIQICLGRSPSRSESDLFPVRQLVVAAHPRRCRV